MPEQDEQIFGEIYNIYNKYRWHILSEQEMIALTNEVAAFAEIHRWKQNPLAYRLACAMVDVFNDFYAGGKVPQITDYIGRSDLGGS